MNDLVEQVNAPALDEQYSQWDVLFSVQFSFTTINQVWNDGSGCHASNITTYN